MILYLVLDRISQQTFTLAGNIRIGASFEGRASKKTDSTPCRFFSRVCVAASLAARQKGWRDAASLGVSRGP
jgi:hypothetical protein